MKHEFMTGMEYGRQISVRLNKVIRVQANIENLANIDYSALANNNNSILPGAPRIYRLTTAVANF